MAIIKTKFNRGIEGATNIVDAGTEGTKVASGTTAQRGSTAGQIRFNSTTGLAEYYTGTSFKIIDISPTVASLDVTEVDSQAGGNQTIVITGSGFASGAIVTFVGNSGTNFNASTVTIDNDTQITAVAPKASFLNAQEPYGVRVTNTSGLSGTLSSQINVDTSPSWQTASGTLFTIIDSVSGNHTTVSATDPDGDTVSYTETASVLSDAGLTLNSSTGVISGNPTDVSSATTLSFILRATAGGKNTTRNFNAIINPTPVYIPIDYLVVAGGGSGGASYRSGGGGAGGYRNSFNSETSGRNSSSETTASIAVGTVVTITVGAGGAMPTSGYGVRGVDSSIAGSGITTITSNGGGGGAPYESSAVAGTYGSGAGAGHGPSSQTSSSGTSGQGFDGGSTGSANHQQGGGGGGAGQNGQSGGQTSSRYGGSGLTSSITGTAVTRAGGGGGGAYGNGGKGFGGSGGAGDGGWSDTSHGAGVITPDSSYSYPSSAAANTGSGGGGTSGPQSFGQSYGSGGSGVIILRMLTSKYSGTTSGSPTVSTSGSDTILIYNASGTYTA